MRGTAVTFGLGAVILGCQPLFQVLRWTGAAYLCWLGAQALRAAWQAHGLPESRLVPLPSPLPGWSRFSQGFLSNITNPKVLLLYLAVLPQFLTPGPDAVQAGLVLAYTHALIGAVWLILLVAVMHSLRRWLQRRRVRLALDATTGVALLGFAARLAYETH